MLSESLERGEVLQFSEKDKFSEEKFSIFKDEDLQNENKNEQKKSFDLENDRNKETENAAEKLRNQQKEKSKQKKQNKSSTGVVYKKLTPELERAYRMLDISVSADSEDLKKAYKEKLKYYHPDRHQNNEILKRVATNKTKKIRKKIKNKQR